MQEQPRKVVFGIAKLTDLIALHTTHDRKLYEKNIRYFIGAGRRGVNRAIKDTLYMSRKILFILTMVLLWLAMQ